MKIIRSKYAGACYGVNRALSILDGAVEESLANGGSRKIASSADRVEKVSNEGGVVGSVITGIAGCGDNAIGSAAVYTLGPIIHNPQVTRELRSRGVLEAETVDGVASGTIVIRSHGVAPSIIEQAEAKGLKVVDATCPHVINAQLAARLLQEQGYQVLVVGEMGHPEVEGISAYAREQAIVVKKPTDLPETLASKKVGVVVQTTQSEHALEAIVNELRNRGITPMVHNTICCATRQRQEAAIELAKTMDVMVVVGGRNSSNTTRLAELCTLECSQTYHIESADELDPAWFVGADKVGITAGASTPENQIESVEEALENLL